LFLNFFMSWFIIITSIRKFLVVLLTVSPYLTLVYYTTGMANLQRVLMSFILQCNWWIFLWNKSLSNYIPLIFITKHSCIFSTLFIKNTVILSLRSWKEKYCAVLLYGFHGERNIKLVSLCITCQYSDMLQR